VAVPNGSPQAGHFILSKSTRCISAGVMTFSHFGQIVLRDASTFSRLIFFRLTIPTFYVQRDYSICCRSSDEVSSEGIILNSTALPLKSRFWVYTLSLTGGIPPRVANIISLDWSQNHAYKSL
jgi:hypothetical protein